jgi:uncharacterized protein
MSSEQAPSAVKYLPVTLTRVERWILANQCRILAKLEPEDADRHDTVVEALERGYVREYDHLCQHVWAEEMTQEECQEVYDILMMFSEIAYAYDGLADKGVIDECLAYFPGFYGNTESTQLGYARYLCKDPAQFPRIDRNTMRGDLDSGIPLLPEYRAMLVEWRKSEKPHDLSGPDLARITRVRKR